MKKIKLLKILGLLVAFSPFLICFGLPTVIGRFSLKQGARCAACRLIAAATANKDVKLC
jgi:hypothetical protein